MMCQLAAAACSIPAGAALGLAWTPITATCSRPEVRTMSPYTAGNRTRDDLSDRSA